MPRTVTVLPSHAELVPSVWMLVIGVMPFAPGSHAAGGAVPVHSAPHLVGVGVVGPVKSATLSSVSCVPPLLRMKPPTPLDGCARPRPSRYAAGAAVAPNASITVAPLRIWMPPVLVMPVL